MHIEVNAQVEPGESIQFEPYLIHQLVLLVEKCIGLLWFKIILDTTRVSCVNTIAMVPKSSLYSVLLL